MNKLKVSTKLSLMYAILMVSLIICCAFFFYKYNEYNIYEEGVSNLSQMSEAAMVQLDHRLSNMDQVTVDVLGNNNFINNWNQKIESGSEQFDTDIKRILTQSYMNKTDIRRVAVFSEDGSYICTGRSNITKQKVLDRLLRLKESRQLSPSKSRIFLSPHKDFWDNQSEGIVVSEIKPITDSLKTVIGYIEIQQNVLYVEEICNLSFNNSKLDTMVFIGEPEHLFFTNVETKRLGNHYVENISALTSQYTKIRVTSTQIISTAGSNYCEGRVVCILDKAVLFKSLMNLQKGIIGVGILLIFITIGYGVIITKFIMRPINLLVNHMSHTDLLDAKEEQSFKMKDRETEILLTAFWQMKSRVQDAMIRQKKLDDLQTKTLFSILQSEIGPHFLYNTLGSIANMCEKGENEEAVDACYSLTEILRYTSNYATSEVRVGEEISNLKSYLSIMKSRYRQRLDYEILADDEAMNFMLPKLTYQPLVENAIKYSLLEQEQVIIKIFTVLLGNDLIIEVKDNGCGITKEVEIEIKRRIEEFKIRKQNTDLTENIQIGGMGLSGTLIRLTIFFGDDFQYELLHNNDEGGTTIVLRISMEKYK